MRALLLAVLTAGLSVSARAQSQCNPLYPVNAITSMSSIYAVNFNCLPNSCAPGSFMSGIDVKGNALGCQSPGAVTVASATALAATPTNCGAGNYTIGVDAKGNALGCTSATSSVNSTNTWTAPNTFTTTTTFNGPVFLNLASTQTSNIPFASGNGVFPGCISGSTITLTLNQPDRVNVSLIANEYGNVSAIFGVVLLIDGANQGQIAMCSGAGSSICNASFVYQSPILQEGPHSFCFGGFTTNTSWDLLYPSYYNQFSAQEIGTGN